MRVEDLIREMYDNGLELTKVDNRKENVGKSPHQVLFDIIEKLQQEGSK